MAPLQFRTGEQINYKKLRVFGCPAQIFVREKDRFNGKISSRSEKGIFIGLSKRGNGFLFRVQRIKQTVEVDSADVKFNETFSDCRDKKGKIIEGGRVLDPDLHNLPPEPVETTSTKFKETSRFTTKNFYDEIENDSESEQDDDITDDDKEVEIGIDSDNDEQNGEKHQNGNSTEKLPEKKNNPSNENQAREKLPEKKNNPSNENQARMQKRVNLALKKIDLSNGFVTSPQTSSFEGRTKRTSRPPDKLVPNFDPTHKLKHTTLSALEMNNLDPVLPDFDQLMSCMEQNVKSEKGQMNSNEQDEIHNNLLDLDSPDPKSQAAIDKMPESKKKRYNDATTKEFEGMKRKNVMKNIRMTDVPAGSKLYICVVNWVTKFVLGIYSKTKCRICFGGHHYVKSFTDCFAPTVNFCSVLIMLCLAAMFGWFIGSLDYSQAYLNADIDEECFLRAPEFLREYDLDGIEFVWKLNKVIYGHPKGSRLWAECLNDKLKQLGYKQFATDQCVYAKWVDWDLKNLNSNSHFVFILVHSDDLIIISNFNDIMLQEKATLLRAFEGIDQGNLSSFCGVEVEISDKGISLSMQYYWDKIMKRFGISTNAKEDKPIKTKIKRTECPAKINEERKKSYLQIIGSIIFGYTHCRLDLAFAVGMFTRVMHNPSEGHLKQLFGFLKYINATKSWALKYFRDKSVKYGMDFTFFAFCDSSHADDEESNRSTGGWFFFLRHGQACVSSKSGQTPDVALSSTEAETIWACSASTQGAFIKQFLEELNIFGKVSFDIMEDSQPAINAQKKNVSQSRFRHIKIKYHYIRQLISEGWCKLVKINTKDQVADIATKILATVTTEYFSKVILGNTDYDMCATVITTYDTLDQSLHDTPHCFVLPYNDWGVMSTPDSITLANLYAFNY